MGLVPVYLYNQSISVLLEFNIYKLTHSIVIVGKIPRKNK